MLDEAIVAVKSLKDYTTQYKGKKSNSSKSGRAPKRDFTKANESRYKKNSNSGSKQAKGPSGKAKPFSKGYPK